MSLDGSEHAWQLDQLFHPPFLNRLQWQNECRHTSVSTVLLLAAGSQQQSVIQLCECSSDVLQAMGLNHSHGTQHLDSKARD